MYETPFFIVGCGRSGTTLLKTMLNRHPEIGIPLESLFIIDYLKVSTRFELQNLLTLLVKEPEIQEWGIMPSIADLEGCETIAQSIDKLHQIYLTAKGKRRWGQKTPRFIRNMDLLRKHFPGSRFVHIIRDPRAVVSSLIQSDVHSSNLYHASLRWKMDVGMGMAFEKRYPELVLRIHYEDMVKDAEKTLRSILSFLDFPEVSSLTRTDASGIGEYSRFYQHVHANLDRPPTDQFIRKWKKYLSDADICIVEAINGDMMEVLGYVREMPQAYLPSGYIFFMRLKRIVGLFRQLWRYFRLRDTYLFHMVWRKWKLGLLKDFLWSINY